MISTTLLPFFLSIYFIAWVCGVVNGMLLRRLFRSRYPDVAERIFPSLTGNSISSGLLRLRYIVSREYREIGDPIFVSRVDRHRIIELVSVTVVALGLIIAAIVVTIR
jgi:small ligand-binding sensory domain FIST